MNWVRSRAVASVRLGQCAGPRGRDRLGGRLRHACREAAAACIGVRRQTIRHGPLANLDMPPITMVFQVKDPMLEQVKAGHKVKF